MHAVATRPAATNPARATQPRTPGHHALYPGGNRYEPRPAKLDEPALQVLIDCRGAAKIENELIDALGWLKERIRGLHAQFLSTGDLAGFLASSQPFLAEHRAYVERLRAVRRLTGRGDKPTPALELPSLLKYFVGGGAILPKLASARDKTIAELAQVDADIEAIRHICTDDEFYFANSQPPGNRGMELFSNFATALGDITALAHRRMVDKVVIEGYLLAETNLKAGKMRVPLLAHPTRGPQDLAMDQISDLLKRKATLEAEITAIASDEAAVTSVVVDRFKAAVKLAGGAAKLAERMSDALAVSQLYPQPVAKLASEMNLIETEHNQAETDAAALARNGITSGTMFDHLRELKSKIGERLTAARTSLMQGTRGAARELVELATRGDESARARIEQLANAVPNALPAGFTESVGLAKLDRAVLADLAATLGDG